MTTLPTIAVKWTPANPPLICPGSLQLKRPVASHDDCEEILRARRLYKTERNLTGEVSLMHHDKSGKIKSIASGLALGIR